MEMLIGGTWQPAASGRAEEVTSPFDGAVIGTVPVADADDVRAALDRAESGAATWRRTPAFERMRILMRAAELADERAEQTAQIISAEAGKTIAEARGEAGRSGDLIRLAAFEGTQLYGDALPLDANRGTGLEKIGFTIHQPVGIVVAITPFNYPALLVMHKLAPALAAGNAVVLKPARTTPLTALALARCFTDAGLPEGVLSVLAGPGGSLGDALGVAVVPGQLAIRLHVKHEVVGGTLGPRLEVARGLQRIEGGVHLDQREVARIVADALRLHVGFVILRRIKRRVVCPTRRANSNTRHTPPPRRSLAFAYRCPLAEAMPTPNMGDSASYHLMVGDTHASGTDTRLFSARRVIMAEWQTNKPILGAGSDSGRRVR